MTRLILALIVSALIGCGPELPLPHVEPHPRAADVLIVQNGTSPESVELGRYYAYKRGIPQQNVVTIRTTTADNIARQEYEVGIRDVVRDHIARNNLEIDFIVTIKGVPLRLDNNSGYSVDAFLMVDAHPSRKDEPLQPMRMPEVRDGQVVINVDEARRVTSPYFGVRERFSSEKFGFYLCTRLDGYTKEDVARLVDNALTAEPSKGVFLLDASPKMAGPAHAPVQEPMETAAAGLRLRGFEVVHDAEEEFVGRTGLMGYASWGSNDPAFSLDTYRSLGFRPGAIAETFVSTSGRTFRPVSGGQSLIADLVRQGVTGVKGYVSEPFTIALARVNILFERYTAGFNLAESFYMASPLLKWKDVVIGDPLCSPYEGQNEKS